MVCVCVCVCPESIKCSWLKPDDATGLGASEARRHMARKVATKLIREAYEEISVSSVGSDRCSSCILWLDLEAPFLLPYHISLHNNP